MTAIPNWLKGVQISTEDLSRLGDLRLPDYSMSEIQVQDVPDEFVSLRAVADCIYGMSFYVASRKQNLENALWVIEHVRRDLDIAEEEIREAIARLDTP